LVDVEESVLLQRVEKEEREDGETIGDRGDDGISRSYQRRN
jgi:hypothetical protein